MLSFLDSAYIVVVIVAASLSFLVILNRLWPTEQRREHNDIVGWQVAVVGTVYAVIIGFMLFAVWTDFEAARANTDAESNALVNLSRLGYGLPQPQGAKIHEIALRYAHTMVASEWPVMSMGKPGKDSGPLTQELWTALMQPQTVNPMQQVTLERAIFELTEMSKYRRLRQLESEEGLPGVLWSVLIVGAVITIASSCVFGTKSFPLHALQVFGLAVLVGLSLMAVAQIDRPFQGAVHVSPEAFVHAERALLSDAISGL